MQCGAVVHRNQTCAMRVALDPSSVRFNLLFEAPPAALPTTAASGSADGGDAGYASTPSASTAPPVVSLLEALVGAGSSPLARRFAETVLEFMCLAAEGKNSVVERQCQAVIPEGSLLAALHAISGVEFPGHKVGLGRGSGRKGP